ncbi:MAG: AEC family transporter [Chthoniobacterales bacterium]
MYVILTLAPILILIVLGAILAHIKFLGPQFIADLNKLVFWVALPVLIFRDIAHASAPSSQAGRVFLVLLLVTLLTLGFAWLASCLLRLPAGTAASFIQAGFRANLAYIGIPVLLYSLANLPSVERQPPLATALLVMAPLTAVYNILAVLVFQLAQHRLSASSIRSTLVNILLNPLIIACAAGFVFSRFSLTLPPFLDAAMAKLGDVAVPVALLCIGGSLMITSLKGSVTAVSMAALIKVALSPVIAYFLGRAFGLQGLDLRVLLIFAACPTAVASYTMARLNQADEVVASGAVALSTILSAVSLCVVLLVA